MEVGSIYVLKTTGELCCVIGQDVPGAVRVRRPTMTHENGIVQNSNVFYEFELESVEDHLRREGKEMLLKVRIQEEMQEEMDRTKKKPVDVLVN